MEICKNGVMDDMDRRIAVALQGNGRASWQQVARVVGSTESTVARRAHRMFKAGLVRVAAISDPMRCGFGYPVLVQLRCEVGEQMRVALALADRSDVRFVALVTGTFDIVIELIAPTRRYLARVLLEEMPKVGGIENTTTETVLRNFKMSYDWSRELLGADGAHLEEPVVDRDGSNGRSLDAVDLKLYELLAEDGRRSFSDLASLVRVSESMVRRRVERMRASGCIKFATLVEPYLLGFDVECLCWVHVDLSRLEETARTLAEHRQVRYLSATIGYSDLICELILRSQDELYEFSTQILGALSGVRGVDIGLELRTIKRAYLRMSEPPPQQGTGEE
jgi:DNA-binding Lrp family transcriptional regulator